MIHQAYPGDSLTQKIKGLDNGDTLHLNPGDYHERVKVGPNFGTIGDDRILSLTSEPGVRIHGYVATNRMFNGVLNIEGHGTEIDGEDSLAYFF